MVWIRSNMFRCVHCGFIKTYTYRIEQWTLRLLRFLSSSPVGNRWSFYICYHSFFTASSSLFPGRKPRKPHTNFRDVKSPMLSIVNSLAGVYSPCDVSTRKRYAPRRRVDQVLPSRQQKLSRAAQYLRLLREKIKCKVDVTQLYIFFYNILYINTLCEQIWNNVAPTHLTLFWLLRC